MEQSERAEWMTTSTEGFGTGIVDQVGVSTNDNGTVEVEVWVCLFVVEIPWSGGGGGGSKRLVLTTVGKKKKML